MWPQHSSRSVGRVPMTEDNEHTHWARQDNITIHTTPHHHAPTSHHAPPPHTTHPHHTPHTCTTHHAVHAPTPHTTTQRQRWLPRLHRLSLTVRSWRRRRRECLKSRTKHIWQRSLLKLVQISTSLIPRPSHPSGCRLQYPPR